MPVKVTAATVLRHTFRTIRPVLSSGLLLLTLFFVSGVTAAPQYFFSHMAGPPGGPGSTDDMGSAARFTNPFGIAVDSAGNIYVADVDNSTIRKITPAGVVTTLAGMAGVHGDTDGTGPGARFSSPSGVAVDSSGTVYVADTENHTIRKITTGGVVTTLAGMAGVHGSADGTGSAAKFYRPQGVAVDGAGTVYVADSKNGTIRKISTGGVVTTLAGTAGVFGSADGTGPAAKFQDTTSGVAVDGAGNVYVADESACTIRKITPGGVVTTLAGTAGVVGSADGTGVAAQFYIPEGIAVDSAGIVYVADGNNNTIRKITPGGVVTTLAGTAGVLGSADGTGPAAQFGEPRGIAVDSAGTLYVTEGYNCTVRKVTANGVVTTLAGLAGGHGSADAAGTAARFEYPLGVAIDGAGTVYVADSNNGTIRRVTPGGVVTTLAGTAGVLGSADGTGPAARFTFPAGIAVDNAGTVYVADTVTSTIRKITGGVVTTLAGMTGVTGSADGTGSAARFNSPQGVAVDGAGTVYVADGYNGTIRKITVGGVVTTLAGTAGVLGTADGTGPAAQFHEPCGVAVDSTGTVYVADLPAHTIRKITPSGVVTTLAGTAGVSGSADGTGPAARFNAPRGVAVDSTGNVYVADILDYTVRKIAPGGVVTTLAGTSGVKGSADGIGLAAQFYNPSGIAVDSVGAIYVADAGNNTVRKGQLAEAPVIATQPQSQTVAPGANVQFSVTAGAVPAPTYQWYFNGGVFQGATASTLSFNGARGADAGDYTVVVTNPLGSVTSNKATLTVSGATVPPPTPPSSGGGSIGGWFVLGLFSLVGLSQRVKRSFVSPVF